MTNEPTPTTESADHSFFAEARAVAMSRGLAFFLFINWVAMGWLVMRSPTRLVQVIAFLFGIVAFIGSLSQIRGSRLAAKVPIIRLEKDTLSYRSFTGGSLTSLPWSQVRSLHEPRRGRVCLRRPDGEEVDLPTGSLAVEDRSRLLLAMRQKVAAASE